MTKTTSKVFFVLDSYADSLETLLFLLIRIAKESMKAPTKKKKSKKGAEKPYIEKLNEVWIRAQCYFYMFVS